MILWSRIEQRVSVAASEQHHFRCPCCGARMMDQGRTYRCQRCQFQLCQGCETVLLDARQETEDR
jgi:tRNA(Ile2) C34 agmatinyltransferase TiaS